MQRKSIVSIVGWTACNVFLISAVIVGCSGADDQASPGDNAEQRLEEGQAQPPCARAQDESAAESLNLQETRSPTDSETGSLTANACVCCSSLWAGARKYCADRGRPLKYAHCGGVCGLCGCDNAYSYIDFSCG
jgi:hypothetical protein